jgi:hypothetical protein
MVDGVVDIVMELGEDGKCLIVSVTAHEPTWTFRNLVRSLKKLLRREVGNKNILKKVPPNTRRASIKRTALGKRHPKDEPEAWKHPKLRIYISVVLVHISAP